MIISKTAFNVYLSTFSNRVQGVFKSKRDYVNKTRTVHFSEEL
jgi:hypothetical protein